MKKLFLKTICFSVFFIAFVTNVSAGSLSLEVTSSVKVGDSVIVTVKADSMAGKFSVTSSDSSVLSGGSSSSWIEGSSTYTFSANKAGSATITVTPIDVADYDGNVVSNSVSKTVTVKQSLSDNSSSSSSGNSSSGNKTTPRISNDRNLSSNNNLSSLSIDGVTLNPEFNKDTTEYSVELEAETKNIKINASAEDDSSSITGAGDVQVSDGMNKIEVVVTAENGSTKTYVINANVKDLDPITVEVNGKTYNVIRKKELLIVPNNYKETTVKINGIDVPALHNNITKYTLVGLKDSSGDINLYIYDSKKNTYTLYKEIEFKGMRVFLLEISKSKIPSGYIKSDLSYNGEKIVAYKQSSSSEFGLVYALNVDTGEKNLYIIDSKEGTIQRYDENLNKNLNNKISEYNVFILGLFGIIGILFLILIIVIIKNKKKKNPTLENNNVSNKEQEKIKKIVEKEKTKKNAYDDMEKL